MRRVKRGRAYRGRIMTKLLAMLFSILSYGVAVATLVYLILFTGGWFVPLHIYSADILCDMHLGIFGAALVNTALIALWGYQHSLMASPAFKAKWTKIIPSVIERSTYLLFVALFTAILIFGWQPMTAVYWDVSGSLLGTILTGTFILGWVIVFISTFLINHFHLFGLEQAYLNIVGKSANDDNFRTPFLYKLVRHPMMTGVLIALWSAPTLTSGRLLFNVVMSVYIVLGVRHEEKALRENLGKAYEDYSKTTPSLLPFT